MDQLRRLLLPEGSCQAQSSGWETELELSLVALIIAVNVSGVGNLGAVIVTPVNFARAVRFFKNVHV